MINTTIIFIFHKKIVIHLRVIIRVFFNNFRDLFSIYFEFSNFSVSDKIIKILKKIEIIFRRILSLQQQTIYVMIEEYAICQKLFVEICNVKHLIILFIKDFICRLKIYRYFSIQMLKNVVAQFVN